MKSGYKNLRAFYKDEAERYKKSHEFWRERAEKFRIELEKEKARKDEKPKRGLECIVYCMQCQIVYRGIVPYGSTVRESGCAHCGVRGTGYLVVESKV